MKYSDMTIEEAEIIQKHIQCEIILDGDNKEILFSIFASSSQRTKFNI